MSHDLNLVAAIRRARMDGIMIDHPRAEKARAVFDFLTEHGRQPGEHEKRCVGLIAPTQSGKSTLLRDYAAKHNSPDLLRERQVPILHVTLQANLTRRQFAEEVLVALAAIGNWNPFARKGTEAMLQRRVDQYLRLAGVQLLVLDEAHHLVHSDNHKVIVSVSETIKRMLIKGVCPIVLSGIEDVHKIFKANAQLTHRAEPVISLSRLDPANSADMRLFFTFLADYMAAMERAGVVKNASRLLDDDVPACILEVTQGVLGAACNLLKAAVRTATLAGRDELSRNDLAIAADEFIDKDLYKEANPFCGAFAPLRKAS